VGVMYQAWGGVALGDGHVQGVQDQLGAEMVGHRPADDPAGERVEDDGEVEPALTGALLGDVSDPQAGGSWGTELGRDQIRGRGRGRVGGGSPCRRGRWPPTIPPARMSLATRLRPTRTSSPRRSSAWIRGAP